MKKFIAIIAFAIAFLTSVTTADAQSYRGTDPRAAYEQCKIFVQEGDDAYDAGAFSSAEKSYMKALDWSYKCTDKKYISDKKLNKKISDCEYAISHDGKTRQEANAEKVAAVLGTALVFGAAVGVAASASSHDCPPAHHEHHHHHVHDYHHNDRVIIVDHHSRY